MSRSITLTLVSAICALVAAVAGCAPPLSSGAYQCDPNDAASCPGDWLCQCRGAGCDWRCYQEAGAYCGDGELSAAEECDPAAPPELLAQVQSCGDDGLPYCLLDCTVRCTACGNGILEHTSQGREECDDGNRVAGDGCSPSCKLARCGDGAVDPGAFEACDDGAANSWAPEARCRPDCQPGRCGDGVVDPGEVCDDGNDEPADHCSNDCQTELRCGNGIVDEVVGEECEDGNSLSHDGCSSDCRFERIGGAAALAFAPLGDDVSALPYGPQGFPVAPGPHPERHNAAMIYDPTRNLMVLFGGSYTTATGETALLGDTWERRGFSWVAVGSAGPLPAERAALAFDGVRQRVVMAALDARGVFLWEWDGRTWQRLEAHPQSLRPAQLGRITFDMRRRTLLLWSGEGTWEWSGQARRWTRWQPQQAPSGPVIDQELVYDPVADRSLLLGDAIWEWSGESKTWRRLAAPAEPPLAPARYAYDPRWQEAVRLDPDNSTWRWHRDQESWSFAVPPEFIGDYQGCAFAFHGGQGILLLGRSPDSETQLWLGGAWLPLWRAVVALPGGPYLSVSDPNRGISVALGAGGETRNWAWDKGTWWPMLDSDSPPVGGLGVVDESAHAFVYIAGENTWVFDLNSGGWNMINHGYRMHYPSLVYDYEMRRVLAIFSSQPNYSHTWHWGAYWMGDHWQAFTVSSNRWGGSAVYHRSREVTVQFGATWIGEPRSDTFEISAGRSTFVESSIVHPGEDKIFYDTHAKRVLRFTPFGYQTWTGSTWEPFLANSASAAPMRAGVATTVPTAAVSAWGPNSHLLFNRTSRGESCAFGFDLDGDGRIGCEDEDCWHLCTPTCSPGQPCPADEPRCGDGTCNTFLETSRLCPEDCGAPVPSCGDFHCDPEETPQTCPGDCS